jgi:uncharacterized protein (TIGR00369 family)
MTRHPQNNLASPRRPSKLTAPEVEALLDVHFPQAHAGGKLMFIESMGDRFARIRLDAHDRILRPGNTVSGPAMFMLADYGTYATLLGTLGDGALQAVTSSLNMTFLQRPEAQGMIAEVTIIKLGRRVAVAEIEIYSDATPDMVAHAVASYALPPEAGR